MNGSCPELGSWLVAILPLSNLACPTPEDDVTVGLLIGHQASVKSRMLLLGASI
jgi:hypothetical protein